MGYLDNNVVVSKKFLFDLEEQYNKEKEEYIFLLNKVKTNWRYYLDTKEEFENYKLQNEKNLSVTEQKRLIVFLKDFMRALDSYESGVENIKTLNKENYESFKDGFLLTYNLINDVFKNNDIEILDPIGCVFDPSKHEAIAVIPGPNNMINKVIKVVQKGYICSNTLVRVARVTVGGKEN